MDSDCRSVNIRLRIGEEPEADVLQAFRFTVKVGHGPAQEQKNYLESLGISEEELEGKPVMLLDCEDGAAAEGVIELLKALPEKAPELPVADVMGKINPTFRVQGSQVVMVCGESPLPMEIVESLVDEVPEQVLNSDNLIELSIKTGAGGSISDIINNTLHHGGEIAYKLQVHRDLPSSVANFVANTMGGPGSMGPIPAILGQGMTFFSNVELNLTTKTLTPEVENQLGADSPVLAVLGQASNLSQFVPPQVQEFAQLKGVKGPLEVYFTSAKAIAVNLHAHLPGLGSVLFN